MPSNTLGVVAGAVNAPPVVTGGTLTSDATYYYRKFTANGTMQILNAPINMDYVVCGGGSGGGTRTLFFPYTWQGYFAQHECYAGGGGGAASNVNTGSVTFQPQSVNILIGAGGYNDGTATSIITSSYINTNALGYRPYGPIGGNNNTFFGASQSNYGNPINLGPDPYYYIGGGGAGAGGNASGSNGGPAWTVPGFGVTLGGGGAGVHGAYYANDYNPINYTYYYTYEPDAAGTPGTGGGTGSSRGIGGNGAPNTGSGGGAGNGIPGQGGSGIVIFRYLRSAVGG